jgi:glutathione synthase/RimK-type ligase-like ATP-grasp enzyme
VFCGYPFSKSDEYEALIQMKIPVPQWALLTEETSPDLSGFVEYVVRKPNYGGRSAGVGIVHRDQVKWKPITTHAAGTSESVIIQQFIYTGALPISYRVSTLFGRVLSCVKYQANPTHVELPTPTDLASAIKEKGFTIVAPSQGCRVEPCFDEDIIRLGEHAHAAFPDIPLLGFDIVQEAPSGKLFVLEANAIGYTWLLTKGMEASLGFLLEAQFEGVRKAAYILSEKTQQYAE